MKMMVQSHHVFPLILSSALQFCLDQGLAPSVLTAISFCSAEPLRQSLHYRDRNDREFPHDAHKRVLWDAQCDKTIFGMDRRPARRVAQNPTSPTISLVPTVATITGPLGVSRMTSAWLSMIRCAASA
jgi:hypothetical protein